MTPATPPAGPVPEIIATFEEQAEPRRFLYVLSDLHLGGPPDPVDAGARGFRLMTNSHVLVRFLRQLSGQNACDQPLELVINGDFVDFLAEPDPLDPEQWIPLRLDAPAAVEVLRVIARREADVFAALREFVRAGHRLTVLLGNHDVELAYPAVRRELELMLGANRPGSVQFLVDGEAYVVGDQVLIEHGNRYDAFNQNDNDGLRELRALQSRREPHEGHVVVRTSPGSHMVASVVNVLKPDHPFVDLVKPETEALLPVLLALNPSARAHLRTVLGLRAQAQRAGLATPLIPKQPHHIAAMGTLAGSGMSPLSAQASAAVPDQLYACLQQRLTDGLPEFLEALDLQDLGRDDGGPQDIARGWQPKLDSALGLMRLLWDGHYHRFQKRLPALWHALRQLNGESPFDWRQPPDDEYGAAARALHGNGFALVLFGHTHLARAVDMANGWYFNTGTWADLIPFPVHFLNLPRDAGLVKLEQFCMDMKDRRLLPWLRFVPTYARVDLGEGDRLLQAKLRAFDGTAPV
jgi:UDP-2,3-diacylglucosamine pyrophosphatase LpxH